MGRLGVAWSDPDQPSPAADLVLRRVGAGLALGFGAAVWVIGFAIATGGARVASVGLEAVPLVVGIVPAALVAVQNELLLRGLLLRLVGPGATTTTRGRVTFLVAAAFVAAGHAYGIEGGWLEEIAAAPLGVALAAIWSFDRGAWMAWAARAAWLWCTGPVVRVGVADVRAAATSWGGGDAGPTAGWAGIVAATALAAVATAWLFRGARGNEGIVNDGG
jgi:hypothetical protein